MASASCFLRTLSLKWSRNDDRVVGKKQQFWCVTNKKCPKLMSEFSEIIFFSSQLFFRCTTSWSLKFIFGCNDQDKTSLTWLQNSMGNTKQLTIIIDTKIRFLRVAHDELQNFLAAEEELKRPLRNAHHAISTKIASQQHQLFKHSIFRPFKENG